MHGCRVCCVTQKVCDIHHVTPKGFYIGHGTLPPWLPQSLQNLVLYVRIVYVYAGTCMLEIKMTFVRTLHKAFAGYIANTSWHSFMAVLKDRITSSVVNATCRIAKSFSSGRNDATSVTRRTLKCITGFWRANQQTILCILKRYII